MNASNVKVSVLVPVFNVCKFLPECLDSIISQTLQDIEIICGDGGSNDGSLEILREYEKKDSRIKIITKEKSGYGQSMNDCFDIARGKYIGIVESDDVVKANMFERLYEIAEQNSLDWIRSDIFYYYSMLEPRLRLRKESIIYDGDFYNIVLNPQEDNRPYKSGLRTWSGIYNADFLRHYDIRHNETPGGSYQDVGFYLKTLYFAQKVMFLDEAFYMWRQDNPGSSVHYDSKKLVDKSLYEWDLNKDYLRKRGLGKRAWCSYRYRQFFSYRWTLEMAKGPDVERVLVKFRKEFANAVGNNEIDRAFFNDYEWGLLCDFLRENRIRIPGEVKKHNNQYFRNFVVTLWMKFAGRLLRPYKNYIRRIIDASNEELLKSINSQNIETFDYFMNRINDLSQRQEDYYKNICAELIEYETSTSNEFIELFNQYEKSIVEIKKEISEISSYGQADLCDYINNNARVLTDEVNGNIKNEIMRLVEKFEATRSEMQALSTNVIDQAKKLEVIDSTRQRVEDIYNNIDKYVIDTRYGKDEQVKKAVNNIVEMLVSGDEEYNKKICMKNLRLIEIEVFSKCNRQCWFCPNKRIDRHSDNKYMPEKVYLKVLRELKDLDYKGIISFSRYNEPLADKVILIRISQAREFCPNAYLRSNTNGDYLTREYLDELRQAGLDELEIQLYIGEHEELTMDRFIAELVEYSKRIGIANFRILETPYDRFTAQLEYEGMKVVYMALNMKLAANNRGETLDCVNEYSRKENCLIPFKNLYLDYTGKYMMCCNVRSDISEHERFAIGYAQEEKLWDVFMSKKMLEIRKKCAIASNMSSPCSSCCYYTCDDDIKLF